MASEVFVDTSGWYALLDRRDSYHAQANELVGEIIADQRSLATSDYVIDETCTLAKARAGAAASLKFLSLIEKTKALRVEWLGSERFAASRDFFEKHIDHSYSFTDCTSFVLMRELGIHESLTTDSHFTEAGFVALLAG